MFHISYIMIHIIYHETFHISCFIDRSAIQLALLLGAISKTKKKISYNYLTPTLLCLSAILNPGFSKVLLVPVISVKIFEFYKTSRRHKNWAKQRHFCRRRDSRLNSENYLNPLRDGCLLKMQTLVSFPIPTKSESLWEHSKICILVSSSGDTSPH